MGRFKLIETPDILWKLFEAYKKDIKENPFLIKDWVGKDGEQVYREREKPLTMEGFECYVCDNSEINYPDLSHYFENKDDRYAEFVPISSRVKREIRRDQIEGGMTMIYSQSITARLNSLVDKQETEIKGGLNIPNLPDIGNRK
jgi:hypothetical protein